MKQKKYKGRYFLDKIDKTVHSTNDYTLYNFYRSIFYGKPFPGSIDDFRPGPKPDMTVITSNDKVLMRKIDDKWIKEE